MTLGARIDYLGPSGAVEAPLSQLTDATGKIYPAEERGVEGGSQAARAMAFDRRFEEYQAPIARRSGAEIRSGRRKPAP